MEPIELAPGLLRWTAPHPAWRAGAQAGSPDDWPQDVGSVAYLADDVLLLIDPMVADDDWPALDAVVERHGRPVRVFTTLRWHGRSRRDVVARYGATLVRARRDLPDGVEPVPIRPGAETMVWLSGPRAVVPGDRLLGADGGGVRVCPPSWLRYLGLPRRDLAHAMGRLRDLPAEMVLVSHGEPVLRDGAARIREALDEAGA